jgi:type VI secretion system secreted protein VgrG
MANNCKLMIDGDEMDVRRFSVHEEMSEHFHVTVWARNKNPRIDLEKKVGAPASFTIQDHVQSRTWAGGLAHAEQTRVEVDGLSLYMVELVPALWITTQRRDHRVFQHKSVPDIVKEVLKPYKIKPDTQFFDKYKDKEYVVQHGETDYDFINRLLEEAGIAYHYRFKKKDAELVLNDCPADNKARGKRIPYVDEPNQESQQDYVTKVRLAYRVRPGKITIRDYSFKDRPDLDLKAEKEASSFKAYEQYHYMPGSFLFEKGGRGSTTADDQGVARHALEDGKHLAEHMLVAQTRGIRSASFTTNCLDLAPGVVFHMEDHPHSAIGDSTDLMVTEFTIDGTPTTEWIYTAEAVFSDDGYRPERKTERTRVAGVQSAVVVGKEEIYCDEYGRVRVQFPWDRYGTGISKGEASSKWMRVSQAWAGRQFGTMMIPRKNHEVLVRYFEGDPEQPVIVGRAYNKLQPVPYGTPKHEIKSVWKSDTSPHKDDSYNEIRLDDRHEFELFYLQAQRDREELVRNDEWERTGLNRVTVVGDNRATMVGNNDVTMVGAEYSVQMMQTPSEKDMKILEQKKPKLEPTDTKLMMKHDKIMGTTGNATFELDQDEVVFEAKGEITLKAGQFVIIKGGPNVKINC